MYYNELGTRVKLAKRRYKGKKRNKIKLVVKPRELQESEIQQMVILNSLKFNVSNALSLYNSHDNIMLIFLSQFTELSINIRSNLDQIT